MTGRIVLASRQFQKQYPTFREKYTDLERHFRDFLGFRQSHRPDEQFNANDDRLSGTKCNLCHLIHGKAIILYQLFGTEIRLIAMGDMDESAKARNYARSLGREHFYTFDDQLDPGKPSMDMPIPPPQQPDEAETVTVVTPPESEQPGTAYLWSDKTVEYALDQQLLYVPRTDRPVVAFKLDKDLMIPKGDMLVFVPAVRTFFHLTTNEFEAVFQAGSRQTTDVSEAFAVSIEPPARAQLPRTVAAPEPMPHDAPQPDVVPMRRKLRPVQEIDEIVDDLAVGTVKSNKPAVLTIKPGQYDTGSQLGRLIHIIGNLEHMVGNNKIDFATIKRYTDEQEVASLSSILASAQHQGFVMRSGKKEDGRSFYYCLTEAGKQKMVVLGEAPFSTAGMRSPFTKPGRIRRVVGAH